MNTSRSNARRFTEFVFKEVTGTVYVLEALATTSTTIIATKAVIQSTNRRAKEQLTDKESRMKRGMCL